LTEGGVCRPVYPKNSVVEDDLEYQGVRLADGSVDDVLCVPLVLSLDLAGCEYYHPPGWNLEIQGCVGHWRGGGHDPHSEVRHNGLQGAILGSFYFFGKDLW
jgi:hypothetical protein